MFRFLAVQTCISLARMTSFRGGFTIDFILISSVLGHQYFPWRTLKSMISLTAEQVYFGMWNPFLTAMW